MTTTRLDLIKNANAKNAERLLTNSTIQNTFRFIAEDQNLPVQQLVESVTHILANIAQTSASGDPIKLMHLRSVAAFLAGVETIAKALPKAQDVTKVKNTLRYLQAASIGSDGLVTSAVQPIAELGAGKQEIMAKYEKMVNDYALSVSRGQANGHELSAATKQLQQSIDQAMRAQTASSTPEKTPNAGTPAPTTNSGIAP